MSSRSSNSYPVFTGLHRVGFIRSAHGIRGEVFVKLLADTADWLGEISNLQILKDDDAAPIAMDVTSLRVHKDGLIAVFAAVRDRNAAEALKGAQVYIPENLLVSEPGEPIYLKEVLNFEVRDPADQLLGTVVDFAYNGAQDLIVLEKPDGKRALVPFVEAFVVEIDFDKRCLRMDLPPGLLTLGE